MIKNLFSIIIIFSLLFPHFSMEECITLEDCPKCKVCEECVEKICPPCEEIEEKECPTCEECEPVCEGQCYTDEEAQNIEVYIQELEQKDSLNIKIHESLELEINQYMIQDSLHQSLIKDMELTIELRDKLIKEVTPKWYENKWLWFGIGVVGTAIIVK